MNVIISNVNLYDVVSMAIDQADAAAHEIFELETLPLEPGETQLDRALLVSKHAVALAEAWAVIDSIMRNGPISPEVSPSPGLQGCGLGATN